MCSGICGDNERMKKKNLEVFHEAVKIADSGKAHNWKDVESTLVADGYKKAPELLADDRIRTMLNLQCSRRRKTH